MGEGYGARCWPRDQKGLLLLEVVHLLEDLKAPSRKHGQAVALDPEVAPAVRRIGLGPEPLENVFPVRGQQVLDAAYAAHPERYWATASRSSSGCMDAGAVGALDVPYSSGLAA
jgi:hypothetical protein